MMTVNASSAGLPLTAAAPIVRQKNIGMVMGIASVSGVVQHQLDPVRPVHMENTRDKNATKHDSFQNPGKYRVENKLYGFWLLLSF
jgi:hypothetical protein